MADVNCELCGCADFYKEAGFYYCKECQTQTQDIQEHVLEEDVEVANVKKTKKVQKRRCDKTQDHLTSWECYNYILLGLVNELIELGANENLRETVEVLWFKYLKKLEVVGKPNQRPKLPALNSARDAEILYGRKTPKKKRTVKSRSSSPITASDISSLDPQLLKRERMKHKKALAKADYAEFASSQPTDVSLVNQSLTSLRSSSEATSQAADKVLHYNRFAVKQIRKVMGSTHFKAHRNDVNSVLSCHKLSSKVINSTYRHSPELISRINLFSIIYLALLINKDKIHLGDMLRFMREGHLSYEHVLHFFPENTDEQKLNLGSYNIGTRPVTHCGLRVLTAKMAVMLKVTKYIPTQNFVELCERYCRELNLPDDISNYVQNLILTTTPKMPVTLKSKSIPNYEGRAISLIIFALKLFFGLDDITEFHFAELASKINSNLVKDGTYFKANMFNFKIWLEYIQYRQLVITENHFPTKYLCDNYENPVVFSNFIYSRNEKYDLEKDVSVEMQVIKSLLEKVKKCYEPLDRHTEFPSSLTPFRDYVDVLFDTSIPIQKQYLIEILNNNFKDASLDFLMHTKLYLKKLNPEINVEYEHGGANNNIRFIEIKQKDAERMKEKRHEKQMFNVTLCDSHKKYEENTQDSEPVPPVPKKSDENKIKNFLDYYSSVYEKNMRKMEKNCKKINKLTENFQTSSLKLDVNNCIYNPSERFWLLSEEVLPKTREEFHSFISSFPLSFQYILKECSRITEQTEKDLFAEYNLVEIFLCYTEYTHNEKILNPNLEKLIKNSAQMW